MHKTTVNVFQVNFVVISDTQLLAFWHSRKGLQKTKGLSTGKNISGEPADSTWLQLYVATFVVKSERPLPPVQSPNRMTEKCAI